MPNQKRESFCIFKETPSGNLRLSTLNAGSSTEVMQNEWKNAFLEALELAAC